MQVESRDSVSLKPAELDVLGQLLTTVGLPGMDTQLEGHVETFPLIVVAADDDDVHGFMFGSLERVGGTPCILWGLGAARKGRQAGLAVKGMVSELYRRAAISFPDEDVLVAGRIAHPAAYGLLQVLTDVVPRPNYSPTGEERRLGSASRPALRVRFPLRRPRLPRRPQGQGQARPRGSARRQHREGWRQGRDRGGRHRRPAPRRGRHRVRLGDRRRAGQRPRPPRLTFPLVALRPSEHGVERARQAGWIVRRCSAREVLAHVHGGHTVVRAGRPGAVTAPRARPSGLRTPTPRARHPPGPHLS